MGRKEKKAVQLFLWQLRFRAGLIAGALADPLRVFRRPKIIEARIRGLGSLHVRPGDSDAVALRQVFGEGSYDLEHFPQNTRIVARYRQIIADGKKPIIIDAGANIGASALWYARAYPEACIVAIEPDPENAELCRYNVSGHENIRLLECAIGSRSGEVTLKRTPHQSWGVQTERSGAGIKICTIEEAEAAAGADGELFLVKIDIEGFEDDLFSTATEWIKRATVIVIEIHDWMLSGKYSSRTLQKALFNEGFEMLLHGEVLVFVR